MLSKPVPQATTVPTATPCRLHGGPAVGRPIHRAELRALCAHSLMAAKQRSSSAAVCSAVAEDQRLAQSRPETGKSGNGKSGNGKAGNGKTEHRLAVLDSDPKLAQYEDHFKYRFDLYKRWKQEIESECGTLADFARGYDYFGLTRKGKSTVYREWAPAAAGAQLIGDFNDWHGTHMQRVEGGAWEVTIPDTQDGRPGIPHGSRIKVRLQHPDGWSVDRIPAWIKYATVEPGKMGAHYDGIHWSPPEKEQHKWQHKRPQAPAALRIYEAHVGMSSEEPSVATYTYFKDNVLPRVAKLGYNAVQLMAVQEHAYYASFGYHVTNPFAPSSRCGNPEELKALVDEAHKLGLTVLLDVVHSHISRNQDDGLAGLDWGQGEEGSYFCSGHRGYHRQWDSKLFNYAHHEVMRYLLSNLRWWLDEYRFDGFRFDGVTSMLYQHHGIDMGFSGGYNEYFSMATNTDAIAYLMLANELIHEIHPQAITVAEDVSGMPGLGRKVSEGGVGFDYRLGMGLPNLWHRLTNPHVHIRDEDWRTNDIVAGLCNRRRDERTVAYVESHDQCIVGDQTLAWRLMQDDMYTNMLASAPQTERMQRGMALHKAIRLATLALGGEGWLSFMGNEFGHPEWVDFPRDGNKWSSHFCRRQWSLVDNATLRYQQLNAFDAALQRLDQKYGVMSSPHLLVSHDGSANKEPQQVIVAERGPLLLVINLSPTRDLADMKVGVPAGGKYQAILSTDDKEFGGQGRIDHAAAHLSQPEGQPGKPETNFNQRPASIKVQAPLRTATVYVCTD